MIANAAACTVSVVPPLTALCVAVMVEVPPATAEASPEVLMVATPVFEDDQVTCVLIFCVLPSLYVPVAVNCCVLPD